MKRFFLLVIIVTAIAANMQAQVTIGSDVAPHAKALLDLKENAAGTATKGFLLPRVKGLQSVKDFFGATTGHQKGMVIYNVDPSPNTVAEEDRIYEGYYYNDGTRWVRMEMRYNNWFYMPSIPIRTIYEDTESPGDFIEVNLYNEYIKQFTGTNNTYKRSPGSPARVPNLPDPKDFFYYITKYDKSVFTDVEVNENGVLKYKLDANGSISDTTIMNIVFVLK